MRSPFPYRAHAAWLFAIALAAAAVSFQGPSAGDGAPNEDLSAQIGRALGLSVDGGTLAWVDGADQEGGLASALSPREVLFLARRAEGGPGDLYRAEVRVAPGPRLVSLEGLRNLTDSSAGDDYALSSCPPHVAVATRVLGKVGSLTVLDLDGWRETGEPLSRVQRAMASISDLQRTGRSRGVGRINVRLVRPATEVSFQLLSSKGRGSLVLEWDDPGGEHHLTEIDLEKAFARDEAIEVVPEVRLSKRPILWAVDTVRAVPWIGPGPIEWIEGRVFAVKDSLRRAMYELRGEDEEDGALVPEASSGVETIVLPAGLEIGSAEPTVTWPPSPLDPPVFTKRKANEGIWSPAVPGFVPSLPNAPIPVYRTYIRSDVQRPYVRVHLLAMDMRQLELHMVGGHEDPKSTTGSTGTGRLPRDEDTLSRVVAAFNGAFKTEHGAYGMMVDRNVLLPPLDDAATIAAYRDGTISMGSWPKDGPVPEEMLSYRQNMDPLVEDGQVNPRRRYLWGFTLDSDIKSMNTIRSGMCMTRDGSLVYAWGEDLTATTLGIAMNAAGCVYGMHLDMNPFHTAYIFYGFETPEKERRQPRFEAELVFPEMRFSPYRYVNGAPKDFFYVTLKGAPPGAQDWTWDRIAQPSPGFVPAVFRRDAGGAVLFAVDTRRSGASLRPGRDPEGPPSADVLDADDEPLLLLEAVLGSPGPERGQLARGRALHAMTADRATLAVGVDGLAALAWRDGAGIRDAVQGEWLIREGTPVPNAARVVAVGSAGGWVFVATGDSDACAAALREQGVVDAVAFAAGSGGPSVFVRSERGLVDPSGREVKARDAFTTTLRLVARPRHLGGRRM